ncbi:LuxR C-terminal-related transcriptional regulator [Mycobacterium sp. Y57]|uniref:AAA family ATPase n=1 Tax=Mycolicibacterium xanthum TaxID=2796469 RepID=UPI001C846670|nr:LuxR family transcriptional regulator [Mycolicibacterium xanthum]MBX7432761.1 LuxR C-terminal-related transcriptional regulator [Mycolicibacterium xanthum]
MIGGEWPLIGRTAELDVIAAALRDSAGGSRGIVLAGVAGVGKTRLAAEAATRFRDAGGRRWWVSGTASARSVPLGAFANVVTEYRTDPLRRVGEAIDSLVGDGLRPVAVCVDDAHLLDDLSAFAVLQMVTRRLATVVLTIRTGGAAPDAITTVWKDHLPRLEIQPLSLTDTAQLLEEVLAGAVESLTVRRLWRLTEGNALYLRHLVAGELSAGRIVRRAGMWVWEGDPELPPTLVELLTKRVAEVPEHVRGVLDALAADEPLELDVLGNVSDVDAVADAEALGLVRIDFSGRPPRARLAHPMLGEVSRSGSLRLKRLRGRIAGELARMPGTSPQDLVRRAVLTVESDLEPDTPLLVDAASAAMQMNELRLAETLSAHALERGDCAEAMIPHAMAIMWQQRAGEAEEIFAELSIALPGPERAHAAMLRAINLAAMLGRLGAAEAVLADGPPNPLRGTPLIESAIRALIVLERGHAASAVRAAVPVVTDPAADHMARTLSSWTAITALGDLGRVDEIAPIAEVGYRTAEVSTVVAHARFPLAALHTRAHWLAGSLDALDATAARVQLDAARVPHQQAWNAFFAGMSSLSRGALADTCRQCREALVNLGDTGGGWLMQLFIRSWLATATAMAGMGADARKALDANHWWDRADPDARIWDAERALAQSWVCAAEGATSQAITIARGAARRECRFGRGATETLLLQTATQFGDRTTAPRLTELATSVQGPRVRAAAGHAHALAQGCGDELVLAARQYSAFGDRLAAADACAHAAVAYRAAGRRGAALNASADAIRFSNECQGADTPALRAAKMPLPLTPRQREIVTLAAEGLSNQLIAHRLRVSVRSVEGHLLRASRRAGVNGRSELVELVRRRPDRLGSGGTRSLR